MKRFLMILVMVSWCSVGVAECMGPNFCEIKNDDGSIFKGTCDRDTGEKRIGTFTYANGDIYTGHFGVRPAENEIEWLKDHNIYTGNYGHGKRHGGGGTLLKTNGDKYVGVWEFDELTIGTYWKSNKLVEYFPKNKKIIKKNNITYILDEGTFEKGKGIIFYDHGGIYVGEFKEGKRDGHGRLYFPRGLPTWDCIIKDGPWKDDEWRGRVA